MPLVKPTLQAQILNLINDLKTREDNQDASNSDMASGLADAIDAYIKTATVTTTIIGTSPAGPVTGTGTGTLS